MKKAVKLLSIILILAIGTSLSGCGSSTSDSSTASPTTSADATGKGYTIGYNQFGSGSYALDTLANNSKKVIEAFGNKPVSINDEFSVEKIVQDVENMISSGVDGLIIWLPAESLYLTIAEKCEKAKIPFVLNDKIPSDPEIVAKLKANPYFVGAVAPANAEYGAGIAKYALNKGYKSVIITSSSVGDASDTPRLQAFLKEYKAGGGQVLAELHATNGDEAVPQIGDALVANPNVSFIYGTGSEFGISAAEVLRNSNVKAKVLTSGLDKQALNLLADGKYMEMVNGDYWISGMLSAVVLQNYLDGTPLKDKDGKPVWIDNVMPYEVPANMIKLYNKFFIDEYSYSKEEIQQMSGKINPSFNYDAFVKVIHDYSITNRLLQKNKEDKVTAHELAAVGITVK